MSAAKQQHMNAGGERCFSRLEIAAWIVLAIYLVLVVGFAWNPTPLAEGLAAVGIATACAHAALFYGLRDAVALVAICLVTTFAIENIGIATGVPFGHYHFEVGSNLPHVGNVPVIVGALWFGMGYFAWIVGGTLLGGADRRLNGKLEIVALPVIAAFVMTQWDVVTDPPSATVAKAWIWHDGGAHFGVPLTNYVGWLLTSWLLFQGFAIYLRGRSTATTRTSGQWRALRLFAILLYLGSALTHLTPWVLGEAGEISDAANHVWRVQDIREATVAVMLVTMLFTGMLATLRLAMDPVER